MNRSSNRSGISVEYPSVSADLDLSLLPEKFVLDIYAAMTAPCR